MSSIEHAKHADEAGSKYTYFVLAASASAIGYSFNIAGSSKISMQLLLFVPVIFAFGLSFYFGLKSIKANLSVSITYANIENIDNAMDSSRKFLTLEEQQSLRQLHSETIKTHMEIIQRDSAATGYCLERQYRFLLLGGASFVLWQATELALRALLP